MKFFRLFLLFPVLFISSCNIEEVDLNTETKYYTVFSRDWILLDVPPVSTEPEDSKWTYYYYDFKESRLTRNMFNYGMMNAYFTDDRDNSIITPLPYDNYYISRRGSVWTEQVTCEFSPGNIRFILKYSDFDVNRAPLNYSFMVRFAW